MSEGPGGPQGATAGGTLAMQMLSQQAMVASQMKRAANDKAIAQMLASKKSGPPAARLGDEIQHKSFLGALAGAVLGAIVTIAEGCLIMAACATGPYALVLVPALMYASYKASDYVEEKQNQLESWINSFCDTDGAINTGSENVNINGKPAARAAVTLPPPPPPGAIPEVPQGEPSWGDIATDLLESAAEKAVPLAKAWGNAVITLTDSNAGFMDRLCAGTSLLFPYGPVLMEFATMVGGRGEIKKDVDFPEAGEDTALCDKETKPPRIAQGSSNVFINNQPAARKGDKLECSAAIVGGSPDVFIGGEQVTYLDIQPEFPPWQRMILGGITIASYLLPPAGLLGKLKNLARLGKLGNLLGKSGKLLGAKLGALLGKTGKSLKSIANKVIRWVTDPVDPVTGAYCDERTDFTLGQTLPLSFTRFHSSVLPLHGLTGVGWSDSWSEYAWVREQGNRVDIISQGAMLRFAFDGDSDTAVNPYHAQYILRRRDDYLELFDRDALSSRFFYDAFPGMRLCHPVTDDTSDDRLAHSPADRMYMLGGMSDTASNRITFERDSQYRITGVSHTDGIRLKLTYHASGYLKAIHRTDNGIQTLATYEQDARGRLTEADAQLDYHLFYEYDAADRIIRWSDNGVVWTMEYGPFDLPVARTDGEGHRWQYRYDKDTLQLTEVINPQGESYLYVLDNCGRVTEEHDWGGVVWRYRYDADGLCTARVNGLEETILYSRDAAGRLAEIITPEGKTQYAYDKSGRLTGIFSPDGTSQRTGYDERGRVNVTTQGRRAIEYHYPDEHTVIRCILPPEDERDRHPDESLLKTTYRYNAAGELTEVILPGDETLTFSRDEAGREVFRHSNRGFACEQGWNAASQLVTQRAGFFPEETTWGGLLPSLVREYRYDSAGNVSAVTSREDYGRETRREYRLDRNGQVTAVTASGTGLGYGEGDESYGYDSCGYLKAQSAGRHRISEETDQYAGGHRLKQAGNTQYDYDAAGRMVSRTRHRDGYRPETERFRWDSRDQLTGYCSAQGEQWEYRHDASGRRTEKRCDRKKIRFTYLWDGDSIAEIREYRDDKLYSVRHLVFNGFELISQQFSRVRQAHPSVAPQWVTRTNHAVSDLTGRPLMLFNSEGKTVWRPGQTSLWGLALSLPADTGYPDPRGELDPEAAPGLLYAGQWQDVESGLCYNRFRYYEPETGMYLVSDPLGLQGGEQTYRYVPNPLRWIDPLGLNKGASLSKMMNSSSDLMGLRRQPQNFWRLYRGKDI
ncbi:PAAR/RHS domain-containing protein [Escherichia coli]|uniref:PAAR/RHS domain-containing protein n=1 Tax=Escherichia coli TaxID=562 RepID=UPI0021D4D6ED|nr:PAAR/RHS domain-containing protein [Escherichia coli]MCU6831823.1 PAAR/RHS domain-containing protein [Escherichia coli]